MSLYLNAGHCLKMRIICCALNSVYTAALYTFESPRAATT